MLNPENMAADAATFSLRPEQPTASTANWFSVCGDESCFIHGYKTAPEIIRIPTEILQIVLRRCSMVPFVVKYEQLQHSFVS